MTLKIGFVCPEIRNDFHNDMAIALAGLGHQVAVYTEESASPSAVSFERVDENGVQYWIVSNQKKNPLTFLPDKLLKPLLRRHFIQRVVNIVRFLWRHRDCDIFVVEREWPCIAMAAASLFVPVRWIGTPHGHHDLERQQRYQGEVIDPVKARLLKWALHRAFRVRANSFVVRDLLVDLGLPAAKIEVLPMHISRLKDVPPEVDLVAARVQARSLLAARYGIAPDADLLVVAARLDPHKGIEMALRALPLVVERRPGTRLMICGGAQPFLIYPGVECYLTHLKQLADSLGIASRIVFMGQVVREDIRHYNAAADIHLAPSVIDTFNYSPVEASLVGTYALVSAMTGCGVWLERAGAGMIVHGGAPEDWADAIVRALCNPATAQSRQQAAAALREMLGLDTLARQWSDWLQACAAK